MAYNMQLDECYVKDPSIVSRQIVGEVILVPIRKNVGDLESIYTLNETAAFAWGLFDGEHTLGEINDLMVSEYEIDEEAARQDLVELVEQLSSIGALTKV